MKYNVCTVPNFCDISARTSDIVQIAAACGEKEINIYLTPQSPIGLEASAATGLTYVGGIMKHYDKVVEHTDPSEGLSSFWNLLNL